MGGKLMAAFWRRGREQPVEPPKVRPAVCVSGEETGLNVGLTYDNANLTTTGTWPIYDYRAI